MKVRRFTDNMRVELTSTDALMLLEELEHVPGGSRLPKIRKLCEELAVAFGLSGKPDRKGKKKS